MAHEVVKTVLRKHKHAWKRLARQFGRLLRKKEKYYGKTLAKLVPPRVPPPVAVPLLSALPLAIAVPPPFNPHLEWRAWTFFVVAVFVPLVVPPLWLLARPLDAVPKKTAEKAAVGKERVLGKVQKVVVLA